MLKRIYLDHNATTPVLPAVVEAMLPFFSEKFGNAASSHAFGLEAKAHLDLARESLLKNLKAPQEAQLIFTSGATEANNLAIKGLALANSSTKIHVVTQQTEHACILESCQWLKKLGHEVTLLNVDAQGFVDPDDLRRALKKTTHLVSIMAANNEIGTIQNLKELLAITKNHSEALFHSDAAQALGKIVMDLKDCPIDLLSFSAHKMYGPKGVGGLVLRNQPQKIFLEPLLHGGGHEFGLRSGTVNVAGAVGMAKAFEMCLKDFAEETNRQKDLRNFFMDELLKIAGVELNGARDERLCQNVNVTIAGVLAEHLILQMPHVAFSTGSACASGSTEPSYVIQALGRSREEAQTTVRFGLGRSTTKAEIEKTLQDLKQKISEIRSLFS